jgi:hypothetical protein
MTAHLSPWRIHCSKIYWRLHWFEMDKILAQRYAFCDFSKIVGFPTPVLSREEWESILPKFQGKEWEEPTEHLLDFHEFIHQLRIVHEDVQINLFRYSLEGISRDWCRSFPVASINSLTCFHATFNSFYEEHFPAECIFEGCCNEFSLLHKDYASHESPICDEAFIVEENIYHEYHEVLNDIHYDRNNIETSGIISDVFVVLNVHEDQHLSFEYSNDEEQVYFVVDISPDCEADINDKLVKKTREDSIGRLVVVIDVNPSHWFWTARLMKVFGHEGKCTCTDTTPMDG